MQTLLKQIHPAKLLPWVKRIGIWGFLFFLAKGLLWLILGYIATR